MKGASASSGISPILTVECSPEKIKKNSVMDIKNGGTTQKTAQKILELIKGNPPGHCLARD
jgi:hypothetical protein